MSQENTEHRANWSTLDLSYDEALARLPEALKHEGFGVVSDIDVKNTFKTKLNADFRRYRIFGACNPALAHAALSAAPKLGALLPCNVVLYETDEGKAVLGLIDPLESLASAATVPALSALATDAKGRLDRVRAAMRA